MEQTTDRPKLTPHQEGALSFEAGRVRALVSSYPDGVREEAEYLAAFAREYCGQNLGTLANWSRKLGYDTVETTLSKILRGKMFEGDTPVMRVKTFGALVGALRKEAYLANVSGKVPFIETPTWHKIQDYIDFKRAPETVCKFGLIIGPTGSQKSECCKHYCALNNHGTSVHIESPETAALGRFTMKLGIAYGVHTAYSGARRQERIMESVSDRSTIIVDNIQRMYIERKGWSQPVFNFLQQLQDDTRCTIILVCVPEFEVTLRCGYDKGYFEQFEGRVGGRNDFLWLDDRATPEEVLAIAGAFKLKDADDHIEEMLKLAHERGRIRILFNALQKAKRIAESERKTLTIDHVRAVSGAKKEGK